ncbi:MULTISPECIES: UDP-2,3-diacylglucosamine diphosphatase [Polaribacter]|uniref:UDP-2,3-diacylglucosamine hydrolase n=1 Tax=Polaribacter butkevichii TaxID=218490 RepID=A0A2P6CBX8_9FLAO|nr:UDP-2,3-diacylglucosamine diphosphatase [Polaribacter butkevichii]PQJ72411.1 UDP-2,3-diacylglucosamine hydrolase [Polaribacter butkevichii]
MKKQKKRKLDYVIISDVHLGTYGCRAKELLNYLKTIQPKVLILNGDIIDIWQFNKRYFPKSHMNVIKHITSLLSKGTEIYYITGNHDEMLRKFKGFRLGNFKILNKLVLNIDDKKAWIFHGDVFDITMQHSKWLAKLGGKGYDVLILINTFINWISHLLGYGKLSLSKKIKNSVKSAVKFINDFEKTASDIAIDNEYDYVICGHIHQPEIREIENQKGKTTYLNSGDWIENLTALEYKNKQWTLYEYASDEIAKNSDKKLSKEELKAKYKEEKNNFLFEELLKEFDIEKPLK